MKICNFILFVCVFTIVGCAGNSEVFDIRDMQERQLLELAEIKSEIELLNRKIDLMISEYQINAEVQADVVAMLSDKLENLRSEMLDSQSLLRTDIDDLSQLLDEKLINNLKSMKSEKQNTEVLTDSDSDEFDHHYEEAYSLFKEAEYSKAIEKFKDFLRMNPFHKLASNSQYWLGECFFETKDFVQARSEYQKVVDFFPKSFRVPNALIKIIEIDINQGDYNKARENLTILLRDFPDYARKDKVLALIKELS